MPKIAVIDLGTNGFRLQIAEVLSKGKFQIIHKEANELQLAAEGFERIGAAAFARGIAAMQHFSEVLKQWEVTKIAAFGTAALRLASNGDYFIRTVFNETGIAIELISGEREADLIYKGMKIGLFSPEKRLPNAPFLMMDVGGGSVEFIIGDANHAYWSRSFNVGVTILKQKFQPTSQLFPSEIAAIESFLNETCIDLRAAIAQFQPKTPAIACGTLDILVKIAQPTAKKQNVDLSKAQFNAFYDQMTFMDVADLAKIPHVPLEKTALLPVSFVLLRWVMQLLNAKKMVVSPFSMKAGVLYELSEK
jgi:exopolyphosphatase / guanosine-5'-triphosphate,3'-diphosphate pyrophosphatase